MSVGLLQTKFRSAEKRRMTTAFLDAKIVLG
jgi:hypothetical protein